MSDTNVVPDMTDPLGRHWRQPPHDAIVLDNTHAVMTRASFDALSDYSTTIPTGVYPGKMWREEYGGRWFLRWFGIVPDRPNLCSNNQREIILC